MKRSYMNYNFTLWCSNENKRIYYLEIWKLPVLKIEKKSGCLARFVKRIKPRC